MSCTVLSLACLEQHASQSLTTEYLTMLFGGWVQTYFGDQSVDPTMSPVMVMIGALNFVSLLYGTVIVTYTAGHMSLNAAATGHIFGKMSAYAPLRVGIALASITPMVSSASSGAYVSVGQVSGMYVIVHGAGAADLLWRVGVSQYITLTNATQVRPMAKNVFSSGETLTSMLLCTEMFSQTSNEPKFTITGRRASGLASRGLVYQGEQLPSISDVSHFYQSMPQYRDDAFLQDPLSANLVTSMTLDFVGGACGSINLSMIPKAVNAAAPVDKAAYYANFYSIDAILRHIDNVSRATKLLASEMNTADIPRYVDAYSKRDLDQYRDYLYNTKRHTDIANLIFESHVNLSYCHAQVVTRAFAGDFNKKWQGNERAMCSSASGSNPSVSESGSSGLLDQLTKGGWIMSAASFSRMNGMMQVASTQTEFTLDNVMSYRMPDRGSFCEQTSAWYSGITNLFSGGAETLQEKMEYANECRSYYSVAETPELIWEILREGANKGEMSSSWTQAQNSANWVDMLALSKRGDPQPTPLPSNKGAIVSLSASILGAALELGNHTNNLASGISNPSSMGVDYDEALFDVSGQTNAITMLATLGEGLKILHTTMVWGYATSAQVAESLASSPLTGLFGIPLKVLGMYLLPLLLASLQGAFVLANILPMVPVLTFVFIVTAFLIICAEALGGIALGSALLASAVGEGLLAVHGLRMAALYGAIFLRPSLHVIGLMLGFAMCNISYAVFIHLWWASIGSTVVTSWDIFDLVMIAGGMPIVVLALMLYCLKAPNLYANNLMSWVATEAVGQFGDSSEYMDSTKQTLNGISSAFDAGLKSSPAGSSKSNNSGQGGGGKGSDSKDGGDDDKAPSKPPSGTK